MLLIAYAILHMVNVQGREGRCDKRHTILSAWAAAQAVADEVEVPCREVGLTIADFRLQIAD
jgi:hypothetical protein